jgi:hypothetical protein
MEQLAISTFSRRMLVSSDARSPVNYSVRNSKECCAFPPFSIAAKKGVTLRVRQVAWKPLRRLALNNTQVPARDAQAACCLVEAQAMSPQERSHLLDRRLEISAVFVI